MLQKLEVQSSDHVTALDISMEKNLAGLNKILSEGATVFYADHHQSGDIPKHKNLQALIDLAPNVCTALIVDRFLGHRFHLWAMTAAFGDNLLSTGLMLAEEALLSEVQISQLQTLGTLLNYNGYGSSVDDLFYHPADLFLACVKYVSPFDFIIKESEIFSTLQNGFANDIALAKSTKPRYLSSAVALFELPDEKWARRVSGVWGNELANEFPDRAHLILTPVNSNNYMVSIRAPLSNRSGADSVASQFTTGGGRAGAAGINLLPESDISNLILAMEKQYA
ncbi:DHH family phosphoesterase [Methylophaga sp. OBS3]|uniref:DHH family phosphoesterase n=1 Tax=Methylophaga sp. OBS3 TaxID=2991934 RepID=UPI00225417CD|nr:DHH family phosphoesterase [Methylophaga sp. OBS3]